jgi:hypothetical protein
VNAGRAAQRVHAQARVVGQRGQPRREAGMARLGERIVAKASYGSSASVMPSSDCVTTRVPKGASSCSISAFLAWIAGSKDDALHCSQS